MNDDQMKHHMQDIEDMENPDHYHYVMKDLKTHHSKPRAFEMASVRFKLLGTALDWKEFLESEDEKAHYCMIRVEASDNDGIL